MLNCLEMSCHCAKNDRALEMQRVFLRAFELFVECPNMHDVIVILTATEPSGA